MKTVLKNGLVIIAIVGLALMLTSLISVMAVQFEVADGAATHQQGVEAVRKSIDLLITCGTTFALAAILWVMMQPLSTLRLRIRRVS